MTGELVLRALALITAAASCATKTVHFPDSIGCCETTSVRIDPAFTTEQRATIREAMQAWKTGTRGSACFLEVETSVYHVTIVRAHTRRAIEPFDPGWRVQDGLHRNGVVLIVTSNYPDLRILQIATHELGHTLGVPHDEDGADSVMTASAGMMTGRTLPARDGEAFFRAHSRCR